MYFFLLETVFETEYQFFTGVKNWYKFFTSEKNRTCSSQMARIRTNSSQLKMRKMWNLSTDVRPPILSKLTIRKFHIFQKWRFGTNSSHGVKFAKCEICGSTCLCARLFSCALWSPAGKGLTSWLSFVVYNCEFVNFPLLLWVRCGTWFLILHPYFLSSSGPLWKLSHLHIHEW